jgi:hypothetical protein
LSHSRPVSVKRNRSNSIHFEYSLPIAWGWPLVAPFYKKMNALNHIIEHCNLQIHCSDAYLNLMIYLSWSHKIEILEWWYTSITSIVTNNIHSEKVVFWNNSLVIRTNNNLLCNRSNTNSPKSTPHLEILLKHGQDYESKTRIWTGKWLQIFMSDLFDDLL